jgi:DNA-directed RNA polymerase specialized sigma24 family protein
VTQTWGDAVAWGRPAFDDVYRSQRGPLLRLAYLMLGSQVEAEDLTQEAFARLYQHFGEIADPTAFLRATLVRTCVNSSARSSARISARRGRPPGQPLLPGEPGPVGAPDVDGMWAALVGVRPARRVVLVLRSHADARPGEIASILGCPESTVRTRLHRGLADLRRAAPPTTGLDQVADVLHRALLAKAAQVDTEQLISRRWAEGPELAAIAPRHDATKPRRSGATGWVVGGVVAALVVLLLAVAVWTGSGSSSSGATGRGARPSDPAAVERALDAVPSSVYSSIGAGAVPIHLTQTGFPALAVNGKPEVLFIGEEWCPFCAAERWPLALALSRFGRLGHLQVIASAQDDAYPGTASVGFHGATYDSRWILFVGREIQDSDHRPLDVTTPLEQSLLQSSGGSVPFIDIGGRWVSRGDAVSPALLQGRSALDIARAIADPSTPISQAVVAEANQLTAAICDVAHEQPASVCSSPVIQGIESHLRR